MMAVADNKIARASVEDKDPIKARHHVQYLSVLIVLIMKKIVKIKKENHQKWVCPSTITHASIGTGASGLEEH